MLPTQSIPTKITRNDAPLPSSTTTIPLPSTDIDDMQDAFGITGLIGYDTEIDYTIGTCKAARCSYSQLLNVSRRNSYTYRTKQKHSIMYAAWTGNVDWFQLLFKVGNQNGIMNVTTSRGRNLYHILSSVPEQALRHNKKVPARLAMLKVLVDRKNDGINNSDTEGNTPFLLACKYGLTDIVKEYLVHHTDKFNIHQANTVDTNNPFHMASEGNHVDICSILCTTSIDMNAVNKHSDTPLEIAANCGYASIVAKLVEYYPQRCQIGDEITTAFCHAAEQNLVDVVRVLAAIPAIDINAQDCDDECTPLIAAAEAGLLEVVKELLKYYPHRLRINQRSDQSDSTALDQAICNGHLEIVKCLCQCDTLDIFTTNENGESAYEIARRWKDRHPEIFKELENFEKRITTQPFRTNMTMHEILRRLYAYDHVLVVDDYETNIENDFDFIGKRRPFCNIVYSQFKNGEITAKQLFDDLDIDYPNSRNLLTDRNKI